MKLPSLVWDSAHEQAGIVTGSTKDCTLECCRGVRILVRWPGGRTTWPCSNGLREINSEEWQVVG